MKRIYHLSIVLSIMIGLNGCVGLAFMALAYAPVAIEGVVGEEWSYKDIEIILSKEYPKNDLKTINRVSFLVSECKNNYFVTDAGELFSRDISKEFRAKGYAVIDTSPIKNIITRKEFQQSGFRNNQKLVQVGRRLGVGAVFKGSIDVDTNSSIKSASLKLIDVKTAKTVMSISTSYKKAKSSSEVAKEIAEAYKLYQEIL